MLGVGAVVEYATDDIDSVSLIGVLDLHIWKGLAIQTGPGVEFVGEEEEEAGETTSTNRRVANKNPPSAAPLPPSPPTPLTELLRCVRWRF